MIHTEFVGFEYRGRDRYPKTGTTEKGKVYVSLILEDPDGCDTVKVRVPEARRDDDDVRLLKKGDNVNVPVNIFFGSFTSVTLAGGITINEPEEDE